MATTYTLISSNTLSSSAASVTFSSIPSTYTDLVVRCSTRDTADTPMAVLQLRFNGSSAGNYSSTNVKGNSSVASSNNWSATTQMFLAMQNSSTATANTFSNSEFYIPSYTANQYKPVGDFGVEENNASTAGAAFLGAFAGLWRDTAAITSLTILCGANFVAGSSFYLYGIKNS